MDVRSLSNSELVEQLLKHGVKPGPILPSTRSVYEKKLQQLLQEVQVQENGAGHGDQYSDSEDEGFQLKSHLEMKRDVTEERVDGVINGINNYSQAQVPACLAAEFNQNLATLGDEFSVTKILKQTEDPPVDDFSELLSQSALGMSATRRKPIKGAAGRPIQFRYDDIATRARMQEQMKDTVTETKPQCLISVPLKIVIFILVSFMVLVILTMENSSENPFKTLTEDVELEKP